MTDKLYFGAMTACRLNYQPNTFMRTQHLKKLYTLFCLSLALFGGSSRVAAQLSVAPNGLPPQAFDALPPASQWSTLSIPPSDAAAVQTTAQMDALVQTNTAAGINAQLTATTTDPPAAGGTAAWSSSGRYLQTRPTGNIVTLLKATLQNNSGSNLTAIEIQYDFTNASTVVEQLVGHRVYYSFTGAAGSWQVIESLSGVGAGRKSVTLSLGSWANGATLYLLWADDNGSGTPDNANQIDNFAVVLPFPGIIVQPQSTSVTPGQSFSLSVGAVGSPTLFYQWLKNSNAITSFTTSSNLTINNAQASDTGFYSVIVSNAFGTAGSTNVFVSVACAAAAQIVTQPTDQTLNSGDTLRLDATASGTVPIRYQWFRNNVAISGATNASFVKPNAQNVDSGVYWVVATNCGGAATSRDVVVSIADPPYSIVGLTNHVWRYNQSGALPSPTWQAVDYVDSGWPTGLGLFALENNAGLVPLINTTLSLNDGGGVRIVTYYFRTSFVLTNDPARVTVLASNYFDDGAVVYVNGTEAFRYNMPGGTIGYGTLASAANPAGETVFIMSNIPPNLLVQGTNVVAVEVHQNSLTSSDVAFGMEILVISPPPTTLAITSEPLNVTANQSTPATFSVGVAGTGAFYQWYRESNGIVTVIPGASGSTFTIPAVTTADAGNYFVAVTNLISTIYSRLAVLTVGADTNPPTLVDADGTAGPTNVLVSFSELISPATATNVLNYRITNTLSGVTLAITRVVLTNGTNVILTTGVRTNGHNYILVVNGIQDLQTNTIATNSSIPIAAQRVTLVAFNSRYRFYDPVPFDGQPTDIGTSWKDPGYNDFTPMWGATSGATNYPSIFYYGPDDGNAPGAVGWHLQQSDGLITYFRIPFNVAFSPGNARLFLSHALDDGAVFYLNGNDVLRVNLPDGPIPYRDPIFHNTPAVTEVSAIIRTDPALLSRGLVVTGQNLLAVSLHQFEILDLQKAYGAQLDARVLSYVTGAVMITSGVADQTVGENQPVTFEATTVAGAAFQWQQNSNNIVGATRSSYTIEQVPLSLNNARFRVMVSNSTSSAVSTNGTLRVIADTTPPTVLSAILTVTNLSVQILYSEAVSAATATNLANYRITNSLGQTQPLTGATIRNGTNVTLTLASLNGAGQRLVINGVRDIAAAANGITNLVIILGVEDLVVARNASWKYLLINTNQTIQTTYYTTNYDDSLWAGPSPGVLHIEPGGLPAGWVKGTQVNETMHLFPGDPGVSNYLNTVYFRKVVSTPGYGGRVTLRGRVLYDDGIVLYLNGVELTRINMPAGTITAATQASGGHESTDSVPTFEIVVTNWVAGNNILAAEVHQNGANSSDMVFGLELTTSIAQEILRPRVPVQIVSQPQSRSVGTNANVAFSVGAAGDPTITYQWRRNGIDIPRATSATLVFNNVSSADAGSYSVRVANSFSSTTSQVAILTITNGGGGPICNPIVWTTNLRIATNGLSASRNGNLTSIVLQWTNPVTNDCGSNATVVLQRALTFGSTYPVPPSLWTNIYTNVSGTVRITNTVSGGAQAFYRLGVP